MRCRLFASLVLICSAVLAAQTAPPRGQQLIASEAWAKVPDGPGPTFQFTKIDDKLLDDSKAVDLEYEKKGMVLHDANLQGYLDSVGKRVIGDRAIPQNVQFRFMALRDPMVNAFALPNGSIYVTTGLLSLLENEAELAGVLGHETAHVFERHCYVENRSVRRKALAVNVLGAAGSWAPIGPGVGAAFGAAVWAGAELSSVVLIASVYGYSREMEQQADGDGLDAMTAAGYDPHAMARAFELLDQDSKLEYEPIATFYHDHPKLTARRQEALEFATTHTPAQPRAVDEKQYLAEVAFAVTYNIESDIENRRTRTAVARAGEMVKTFPSDPEYQVLLGEAYRALGAETAQPTQEELTPEGQSLHRKEHFKMTAEEEQKKLLEQPGGQAALQDNRASAEKLFQGAIENHPSLAPAYRELGFLYQDEGRYADAAGEYRHYLNLVASTSLDHLRIEMRLAEVEKLEAPQPR